MLWSILAFLLANVLCLKNLRCLQASEEYVVKKLFFEGLQQYIAHNMRTYCNIHRATLLQKLLYQATALDNVLALPFHWSTQRCSWTDMGSQVIFKPVAAKDQYITLKCAKSKLLKRWNVLNRMKILAVTNQGGRFSLSFTQPQPTQCWWKVFT